VPRSERNKQRVQQPTQRPLKHPIDKPVCWYSGSALQLTAGPLSGRTVVEHLHAPKCSRSAYPAMLTELRCSGMML
jgi:hypothetical protein